MAASVWRTSNTPDLVQIITNVIRQIQDKACDKKAITQTNDVNKIQSEAFTTLLTS
jgi:hypothetical protein